MVLKQISQIADTPQGGKALLKFVIICCAEESKLGDRNESSFGKLIRSHEGGFNIPLENQVTCNDKRVGTTTNPSPTKPSNLFSTFL